ncbi:MAG: hypothetical protein HOP29_12515 [Phycisphaerales bacterium]|nr:hypothetical protein [Phycisphaerales bacterium]
MRIEYDPNLIEQAVFLKARMDRRLERELHTATDPFYASAPGHARESKFSETYSQLFHRFGLDEVIAALLAERPIIAERAHRFLVRRAGGVKDGGAELFVRPSADGAGGAEQTVVIAVTAEQLCDGESLQLYLRRELLHIADMLDDRFGYRKEEWEGPASRRNLVRDRYGVLWNGYVEGRLLSEGRSTIAEVDRLKRAFDRAFATDYYGADPAVFARVVYAGSLTHCDLWTWAENFTALGTGAVKSRVGKTGTGDLCPLCRFPTCDWHWFESDRDATIVARVRRVFPKWNADDGACRQCVESSAAWSENVALGFDFTDRLRGDPAVGRVVSAR